MGIPLIVYILLNEKTVKRYLFDIFKFSFAWGLGYGGMWIGKWILSDAILKTNVIGDGIRSLIYRASGDTFAEIGDADSSFVHTVLKNCSVLNVITIEAFVFGFMIFAIFLHYKNKPEINLSRIIPIISVSVYPFIWYFVVRNHSVIHPWFEYQELTVSVFGLLCLFGLIGVKPKCNDLDWKP